MRSYHLVFLFFFSSLMACQQVQENGLSFTDSFAATTPQDVGKAPANGANIVFQSTDGGQTWQDISAGLPEGLQPEGFLANEGELYLGAKGGMYRSSTAATAPVWAKEISFEGPSTTISTGSAGVFAYGNSDRFFQKLKGTDTWLPKFTNFPGYSVRTVFESKSGTIFIGCDAGIYKSIDNGKTWKHVFQNGWVIKMVESDGVLLCTNEGGILRSTDGGENWDVVLYEGGVGIAVEVIKGGFAAITYNTESKTRRVRTSADGGKTWQPIDAGLPPSMLIASIKQVGDDFFCGHPDGIFRSDDKGKTWNLLLPSIGKKVFNLSVSNGVIYAVPRDGGC